MESVTMGRLYSFGRPDKMAVPVQTPPSPPEVKYENDFSLGPYYANYWSLVGGSIQGEGLPTIANGTYISPYGSAPEPFFPAIQDPEMPVMDEVSSWSAGCGDPNGLFTHSRSTSYVPVTEANPYTPPLDGCSWNQYPSTDTGLQLQSLPALENLANQILNTLVTSSAQDFCNIIASPGDEGKGQAYATVEALFEQQKRLFSRGRLFLDNNTLSLSSPMFPRVARKTNLATFVASIYRGQDIPFLELDEAFLDIFMPMGSRLLKTEAALWLELKTQAFITIMTNGGTSKDDVLDTLFPTDLQLTILRRRSEPTHLAPSEQDFLSRLQIRRQYLTVGSQNVESLAQLPQKYNWRDFLEETAQCVRRVLDNLDSSKHQTIITSSASDNPITRATIAAHTAVTGHHPSSHVRSISQSSLHSIHSIHSPIASQYPPFNFAESPSSVTSGRSFRSSVPASASPTTPTASSSLPLSYPRTTSHPSNKAMPGGRRPNAPSPRRPWTPEEEKALLDGLERVKGPHWSQILALYGAGGSISEVLKDRNQVQLKDKARNLKLFFLKSGAEVPGYLKRVTGELRTRAPGQAARRERERRREEEERNRRDTIPSAA